jgi:caffeoyl-CoA O-methyltransferase
MLTLLPDAVEAYVLAHTSGESELLQRLVEETQASLEFPQMNVGRVVGQFLGMMVRLSGARRVLEVGTFSGYSGLCLAEHLPSDGQLITCDVDPKATNVARRYFDESGYGDRIEIRMGPAIETLANMDPSNPFDLAFIDADKTGYADYFEHALRLVRPGGAILADNTLWSARVLDPQDDSSRALADFNAAVNADPRVDNVLLSIRDGIMLSIKR